MYDTDVFLEITLLVGGITTQVAGKWFFSCMYSQMLPDVGFLYKLFATESTFVRGLLSRWGIFGVSERVDQVLAGHC